MGDSLFSDSWVDGCAVVEEARETPGRMKQITAAQPSSAMSVCGDCNRKPCWNQIDAGVYTNKLSYVHTHHHVRTYTYYPP